MVVQAEGVLSEAEAAGPGQAHREDLAHSRHQAAQPQGHQAWQPNHAATTVGLEGVGGTSRGRVGWHMQSPVIIKSFVEQLCSLS